MKMTLLLALIVGCSQDEAVCDEATITLESIAEDPSGLDGAEGIACGAFYVARTDGITNECGDSGLDEPELREGTYAIWESDWGLVRRGYSVGVLVLDEDGTTEITEMPDVNEGDSIAVEVVVRYGEVFDPCSNSLFGSAYLEIEGGELGF
jgi:hypothetical protein